MITEEENGDIYVLLVGAGEDSRIIEITGTLEAGGEVVIDFGRTGYLAGGIPVWMDSSKHGADWTNRANLLNSNYRNYYETDMQEEDGSYWDWYEDKLENMEELMAVQ